MMRKNIERTTGPMKYSIMLIVMLGATLLLIKQAEKSQRKTQDQQIIVSYDQDAIDGKVPMPIRPDAVRVIRREATAPPTMVEVVTRTGETNRFNLVAPEGNSGTNWHFSNRL